MNSLAVTAALLGLFGIAPSAGARPYDFNGDGRQNVVLGVPGWSAGGAPNAGAVITVSSAGQGVSLRADLLLEGEGGLPGIAGRRRRVRRRDGERRFRRRWLR